MIGTKTWQKIKTNDQFIKQFKRYLQDINSIEELQYVFNSGKASETQVKEAFREMMIQNADDFFNSNPNLFKKYNGINGNRIEDIDDFIELINSNTFSITHQLLSFIRV